MEEFLQDISEFPFDTLFSSIFMIVICSIVAYCGRPRGTNRWKHWKWLAVIYVIWWFCVTSIGMGRPFVSKENFESLVKIEGILQYNDDEGFHLPITETISEEKYKLKFDLLDDEKNLLQFKDEFVGIWRDGEFAYQLEHNGRVIYSLEQSNSKVLGTKKNFKSLRKIEGILKYNDNEGFYMIDPSQVKEKHFYILVHLLDYVDNISAKYENQFVTIWQKNHVAYQLECNGDVIYSLERSNSKIWLGVIWDLITFYGYEFGVFLVLYFAMLRTFER